MQHNLHGNGPQAYNDLYTNHFNTGGQVKINRLIFIPTKQYNDIFRRSYEMNAGVDTLNRLQNTVEEQLSRGSNVNALSIANSVPELLKISDRPGERINIANGWGTVRLRFLMEVESDSSESKFISYIQGYSDYHDPSMFGTLDPKMPLHINSITNVIRHVSTDGRVNTRVHSSFNVIYDPYNTGYSIEDTTITHRLLRPKDIADGIDVTRTHNAHIPTTDKRSAYGFIPQESKRGNNIAAQHVAEVINSFALGDSMADIGYDVKADIYGVAASNLMENKLTSVPFVEALSMITGIPGSVEFNLETLAMFAPYVEQILTMVDNRTPMFNTNPNNILDTGITERLDTMSIEATIANTISETVSSLLVDEMLSTIDFSITNMSPNSELVVAISDAKSFIHGIDVRLYTDRFMNKFKALVMPGVTKHNLIGVDIYIHSDVLGETTVAVSVNGNHPVVYRLPTFCNSLYTSVVSSDNNYRTMVEEFGQILEMAQIGN